MSYTIRVSETADDDLSRLPPKVQKRVHRHLFDGLAEYPNELSASSISATGERQRITICDYDVDGEHWELTIQIINLADEINIEVLGVGVRRWVIRSDGAYDERDAMEF